MTRNGSPAENDIALIVMPICGTAGVAVGAGVDVNAGVADCAGVAVGAGVRVATGVDVGAGVGLGGICVMIIRLES